VSIPGFYHFGSSSAWHKGHMAADQNITNILARKFWVFDLDGTLTIPVHDFARIRAALGIPDGSDILDYLSALPPLEAELLHERLDGIERELVTETGPAPGAADLVELLFQRGCCLGILTRNTREIAEQTLAHIGLDSFFARECILGRADAPPKPDPEGIYLLARFWGAQPAELVMAGDYLYDLQAGQAAGAATIHVHGSRERRWPEWTDLCVSSLAELAEMVLAETL
jgi:phosphoglycolate phosphatase-like HAD superfamily hydrolase